MPYRITGIRNKEIEYHISSYGWRPIHAILEYVNDKHKLKLNLRGFGFNHGAGIEDAVLCKQVGDIIQEEFENMGFKDADDSIYLALSRTAWVDIEGNLLDKETATELKLDEYDGMTLTSPLITESGEIVKPIYSINKDRLNEFAIFLKLCGGFEIW